MIVAKEARIVGEKTEDGSWDSSSKEGREMLGKLR